MSEYGEGWREDEGGDVRVPSDVEDEFDLNGEQILTTNDLWYQTYWDPTPADLGSKEPISVTEAVKQVKDEMDKLEKLGFIVKLKDLPKFKNIIS